MQVSDFGFLIYYRFVCLYCIQGIFVLFSSREADDMILSHDENNNA